MVVENEPLGSADDDGPVMAGNSLLAGPG